MKCDRYEELFSSYWEEELSSAERNTLDQHFESCGSCKKEYAEFVSALEMVQGLPRLEPPVGFTDSVLARVRSGEAMKTDPWWEKIGSTLQDWRDNYGMRPALAAAAAVAVVLAAVAVTNPDLPWKPESAQPEQKMASRNADRVSEPKLSSNFEADESVLDDAAEKKSKAAAKNEKESELADGTRPQAAGQDTPAEAKDAGIPREIGASSALQTLAAMEEAEVAKGSAEVYPIVPDSLFDHAYDFEFALDSIHLRHLPGDKELSPARPVSSPVEGKPASFTF